MLSRPAVPPSSAADPPASRSQAVEGPEGSQGICRDIAALKECSQETVALGVQLSVEVAEYIVTDERFVNAVHIFDSLLSTC